MLIYDILKFRKDPSIKSQEIANYISVALAVALSVFKIWVGGRSHTKHICCSNQISLSYILETGDC